MSTDRTTENGVLAPFAEQKRTPVTVVVPVKNEEQNIGDALRSVAWADEVIVVDSRSSDRTAEIARAAGAEVVQFDFSGHGPRKKEWALRSLPFRNEWVLLLDGDERISPELRDEIRSAISNDRADGFCIDREFIFMGRELRCFRPNWNLRLFRHRLGSFEDSGLNDLIGTGDNEVHEHVQLDGRLGFLSAPLKHEDYRDLSSWLERHNRYSTWEAHFYRRLRSEPIGVGPIAFLTLDPFRRKRVLRRLWVRLPGRPGLRFFTWYVLRRGFFDGREGFSFCLLMAWHEYTISMKLREFERSEPMGVL